MPEINQLLKEGDKTFKKYKPRGEPENLCPWCRMRYERRKNSGKLELNKVRYEEKQVLIDWK